MWSLSLQGRVYSVSREPCCWGSSKLSEALCPLYCTLYCTLPAGRMWSLSSPEVVYSVLRGLFLGRTAIGIYRIIKHGAVTARVLLR